MSKEDKSEWTPLGVEEPHCMFWFSEEGNWENKSESVFHKKDLPQVGKKIQLWLIKQAENHTCKADRYFTECNCQFPRDRDWCTVHDEGMGRDLREDPLKYWQLRKQRDWMPLIYIGLVSFAEAKDDELAIGFKYYRDETWSLVSCSDRELADLIEKGEISLKDGVYPAA